MLDQAKIGELTMAMFDSFAGELDDDAELVDCMLIVAVQPKPSEHPGWVQYRHFATFQTMHEALGTLEVIRLGISNQGLGRPDGG